MSATPANTGCIVRVDDARRVAAVDRLVSRDGGGGGAHARRFLQFAEEHQIDMRFMWARLDERGETAATVLIVPSAGRTAMVFTSPLAGRGGIEPMAKLVDHCCSRTWSEDAPEARPLLMQVLVDPSERRERRMFLAAGFSELARLSYLERPIVAPAPRPVWPEDVSIEPYDESRRDDMLAVLGGSYEQTLDCPGLLGLRRTDDILTGHMATGCFDPALWTMLRIDGVPAGALLLNPSSGARSVELVYLGLTVRARGRGLGRQLLRHGIHLLQTRPERTVTLAVDEDNAPAIAIYRGEGFRRILRRVALIRARDASSND